MRYDLAKLPHESLMRPMSDAGIVLARLDERVSRSPVGEGWIERSHFTDACASLWIDGELVHLEDIILHDATKDIRTPTHELIALCWTNQAWLDILKHKASGKPGAVQSSDSEIGNGFGCIRGQNTGARLWRPQN